MKTVFELIEANGLTLHGDIEHFAALVREEERDRITQLLYKMHERAASQHNYYKHVAIEINRKE